MNYLRVSPQAGEIYHFYHYFGALVLPVLEAWSARVIKPGEIYHLASCGAMDKYTVELFQALSLELKWLDENFWDEQNPGSVLGNVIELDSYDRRFFMRGGGLGADKIARVRHALADLWDADFRSLRFWQRPKLDVLMIGRKAPAGFYKDRNRTSGTERRSLPNEVELAEALASEGLSVKRIFLEDYSLQQKCELAQQANVLLLQHGAALQTAWFMREGSTVLEIMPRQLLGKAVSRIGEGMAASLGLEHQLVVQAGLHQPVNIAEVVSRIGQVR